MESLKNRWQNMPLRSFFLMTVLITLGITAFLSALVIWGCVSFRHWLLPDANEAYLTVEKTMKDGAVETGVFLMEYGADLSSLPSLKIAVVPPDTVEEEVAETRYSLQKLENSFSKLTPKRKLAYRACGVLMVAVPVFLAFAGTILCSFYFYRKKLRDPLAILSDATKQIVAQDLDFKIEYSCEDEMGSLCRSFEQMREALCENNKEMWKMLEERRILQASVAHDLRNPIAIIEGYTEYLDEGLMGGTMDSGKICHIVQNLKKAAKRLRMYTESVRLLNQSEDILPEQKSVSVTKLVEDITEDFRILAGQNGIALQVRGKLQERKIQVDSILLYRILENILNNALRYAREEIHIGFSMSDDTLSVTVEDDGEGFSPEILRQDSKVKFSVREDGHMGIGLAVSRLLCKKHGGALELSNAPGGACVKISLSV